VGSGDSTIKEGYVLNRVNEVQTRIEQVQKEKGQDKIQCRHIPSEDNPADMASRGTHHEELAKKFKFWMHGPAFLNNPQKWPQTQVPLSGAQNLDDSASNPIQDRIKVFKERPDEICAVAQSPSVADAEDEDAPQPQTDSGSQSEVSVPDAAGQPVQNADPMELPNLVEYLSTKIPSTVKQLTLEAIEDAEAEVVKELQAEYFPKELKLCKAAPNRTIITQEGDLKDRQLWLDPKGLLRFVPRDLHLAQTASPTKSAVTDSTSEPKRKKFKSLTQDELDSAVESTESYCLNPLDCPLVLDRRHVFARIVVIDAHKAVCHQGRDYTKAQVCCRYHIPRGSSLIAKICYECSVCRARTPKPMQPMTAGLHQSRLQVCKPAWFETGMDHFGPFLLKNKSKRWGLIFIDLTSRAIHVESVPSPNKEHVILAMERFFNRRARPHTLHCDLGTGFTAFAKEIKNAEDEYKDFLTQEAVQKFRIRMAFNPAGAPHWGGSWERMIKEIKKILKQCMESHKNLSDAEFYTFLTRAEAILNRRPLAFQDDGRILTPNDLINPVAGILLPMTGESTIASVRRIRDAIADFWHRWQKLYLTSISVTKRLGRISQHDLQPGDWVLVRDSRNPLIETWTKGKITQVFPGQDGLIRAVNVDVDGNQLYRDINKISILRRRRSLKEKDACSASTASSAQQ